MDDEEYTELAAKMDAMSSARKHDKWTFILLAVDLANGIVKEVSSTIDTVVTVVSQHRNHKIEEDKFYEITRGE